MKLRKYLVKIGLLDFKVGDKVKPNPKIFYSWFRIVEGQDYAVVREVNSHLIRLEGTETPYIRKELVIY